MGSDMMKGHNRPTGGLDLDALRALAESRLKALTGQKAQVEPEDLRALAERELRALIEHRRRLVVEQLADGTWRSRFPETWVGPMVPTSYPEDLCYICEQPGADSVEHVVARCFNAGTVSNKEGPQLPAHKRCNGCYSGPEEYVRNSMVGFDDAHGRACDAAREDALSAMNVAGDKTGEDARHAKAKRERQLREVKREGGLRKWDHEQVDHDRWNAVLFKIVRGLAYWSTGLLLPWPAETEWEIHMPWQGVPLQAPTISSLIGDAFEAQAVLTGSGGRAVEGDFRLTFYQGVRARLYFRR